MLGTGSVADIFQEVDEEVRRERLNKLWQRYGSFVIAACVLVIAGVAAWRGYEYWLTKKAGESGAAFEAAVTLAEAGKHQEAEAAFAKLAADGTAGYRVLARLREAAELAQTDRKAAVKAYDEITADKSAGQVIQDLAAVRAGFLLVDTAPYSEMQSSTRGVDGTGPDVSPFRTRTPGALRLEVGRYDCSAQMGRHDHVRSANTGGNAQPRRDFERTHRGKRKGRSVMPMGRTASLARLGSALALVLVLAGCTKGGQFDPTDVFSTDMFDTKKKLQGQREPVFPNGVPGTTTGVPQDLVKGYQPPPDQAANNGDVPGAPAAAEAAPAKPEPKPKPKPKVARASPPSQDPVWNQKPKPKRTQISVGPAPSAAAPAQQGSEGSQTAWPAPPPTGSAQQTAQPAQSVWPAPPPTGSVQQAAQPSQSIWPTPPAPASTH